ncbi:SIMPL domain-containing protein [Microbacterium gorillae]|uniref:SIMPL domain-containing protein n=1 Tax=Microbacterium gorillae TaxID=1231063 RepID=UPI00058B4A12|nr:SIMPL domain-containing protein [Microbacterium gorillae]
MTDVVITVRGEHEARIPAELGIANVSARVDGPDRAEVVASATRLAAQLREEIAGAAATGAVSEHSSERLSVWSNRPWSDKGKQQPLVHNAVISTRSEWTDFSALSEWIGSVSEREGITVDGVSWRLSEATDKEQEAAVAQHAVAVAVARAQAYADALGLGTVQALEVADAGLLGDTKGGSSDEMPRMAMMAGGHGGNDSLALEPQPIRVSATVEARFRAS